MASTEKF